MRVERLIRWSAACAAVLCAAAPQAAEIAVQVRSAGGKPVADAVVIAVADGAAARPAGTPGLEVIDQVNHEFVPRVKVVLAGTPVSFPNKDNVRHHVYSFSPARRFELPLYAGTPAAPVLFDKPGVVVLGCNIHDWMIAWVYVSESPWFAKTGPDGRAVIAGLPARAYSVRVWHPQMETSEESTRTAADLVRESRAALAWELALKPEFRPHRHAPGRNSGRY